MPPSPPDSVHLASICLVNFGASVLAAGFGKRVVAGDVIWGA
jgi:hypothetical protein